MATHEEFTQLVEAECKSISDILISKNKAYGNSALEPLRIFSRASVDEQLKVRIDDKLSRIARGSSVGEDVVLDLIGYLVIYRVQQKLLSLKEIKNEDVT